MQTKICKDCFQEKPFSDFSKHKTGRNGIKNSCKDCDNARKKRWYEANREYAKGQARERTAIHGRHTPKTMSQKLNELCTKARLRKKKEFSLTHSDLLSVCEKQNGLCAYSGMPLTHEANHYHTVSLDRIDSSIGYLPDNIQLVCAAVNRMKQEFPEEVFLDFCEKITNNRHKTTQAA